MESDPRPAQFPLPGGQPDAAVSVEPLVTGERRTKGRFGRLGGATWVPVGAFLVRHPGAGALLVDCGLHPSVAHDPVQNLGRAAAKRAEIQMAREQAVDEQLRARGGAPEDVRVVLMTHLHVEQASGASELSGATFLVDDREWAAAASGEAGYHARQIDFPFDWRTIDYAADGIDAFLTFGRAIDVFGDGAVRLLSTPGHSPGHQSVLLRTAGGAETLLCGDAAATAVELGGGEPLEEPADAHLHGRSLGELRRFVEMTPTAVVVPGHDPQAAARLT